MSSTADILIIGGGIAGLSLAAALPQGVTVVLAESEAQCAFHTSSRSARQMQPSYGPSQIRALTEASIPMVDVVASEIGIPLLKPRPLIWFAREGHDAALDALVREASHLERPDDAGLHELNPALRLDKIVSAAVDSHSFEVNVPALIEYYEATARRKGLTLHVSSPVTRARVRGRDWEVGLGSRTITVQTVVNASGAWGSEVGRLFGAIPIGLEALGRTVAVAQPTLRRVDPAWSMASDVASTLYFRPDGANILMSPSDEVPMAPGDAQPDKSALELVRNRINEMTDLGVEQITRAWSGLRTFASDHLPVAGFDPAAPGFYWLVGQGGYGIQTSAALAQAVSADILGTPASPGNSLDGVMDSLAPGRFATDWPS